MLAASTSESIEYMHSTWRQMLLAATPARYATQLRVPYAQEVETQPDGQAKYVPQGLRVIEALLLEKFSPTTSPSVTRTSFRSSSERTRE